MEIEKILKRINLDNSKNYTPILETLQLLQKQYILNVPYENLDFVLNREFRVELSKVYEKIVIKNRGGICYESHTLFIYLLKSLGFKAHLIFAKVEDLTYIGKDYPHLVILVEIDGIDYLVDVANGQNVREPMNINDESFTSSSEGNNYKIKAKNDEYTLFVNYKENAWLPRYYFTKDKKILSDYIDVFKNDKSSSKVVTLVTLAKKDGRVTLYDNTMTIKEGKNKKSWKVNKEDESKVLKDYFNMEI